MLRFRLFGIPITVLPWFWITMLLLGSMRTGSLSTPQDFFQLLLFILAAFFSVLVHELGHGLTIKKFGADTQIVLEAFGGFATSPQGRFTRLQDFLITAAGPGVQLLLGFIVWGIAISIPVKDSLGNNFLLDLYWISFLWAILNLVPVFPLDGGRILNAILGPKLKKVTHIVSIIAALVIGVFALKYGFLFGAFFMVYFAYQNVQFLQGPKKPNSTP